jgi:hypothetical protein
MSGARHCHSATVRNCHWSNWHYDDHVSPTQTKAGWNQVSGLTYLVSWVRGGRYGWFLSGGDYTSPKRCLAFHRDQQVVFPLCLYILFLFSVSCLFLFFLFLFYSSLGFFFISIFIFIFLVSLYFFFPFFIFIFLVSLLFLLSFLFIYFYFLIYLFFCFYVFISFFIFFLVNIYSFQ